jgi:hypothetical protein
MNSTYASGGKKDTEPFAMEFDQIVLESNEFDIASLREMPNYQQRKYPDALYMGQIVNGKRNGKGVMRYKIGRQYEGDWL